MIPTSTTWTTPRSSRGRYGAPGTYGKQVRWHRPVAWMLALVMGIGMVALAFTRGLPGRLPRQPATGSRRPPRPVWSRGAGDAVGVRRLLPPAVSAAPAP